jgi:COMPASS component SPP1
MFFVELLRRGDPYIETIKHDQYVVDSAKPKKLRKRRKLEKADKRPLRVTGGTEESESRLATPAYSEDEKSEYETDSSADEDDLVNRGFSLRAAEVRAVASTCKSVEEWHNLGRKPATPPPDEATEKANMIFDDFERHKLGEIELQKVENARRLGILEAREQLLEAVKARSTGITDEVKKTNPKWKEICGFDPRLAWSEDMFVEWYEKKGGKEILSAEKPRIGFPEDTRKPANGNIQVNGAQDDSDVESDDGKASKKGGVCIRNRCTRHRTWAKSALAEIRFEQDFVKRSVRQTEELQKGLNERGVLRALELQ